MTEHANNSERHHAAGLAFAAAAVILLVALLARSVTPESRDRTVDPIPDAPYIQEFAIFGTFGRFTFWVDPKLAQTASRRIIADLQQLHNAINVYDPKSELSKLNASAFDHPVACSDVLWELLLACRKAHSETEGAFDVSVGPLMKLWGFHGERATYPTAEEVAAAKAAVGLGKIAFDDTAKTVRFPHPETSLDMGGIAKGYALDRAVRIARDSDVHCGLIDLGGNIYCLDKPPPGRESYTIGVRDPFNNDELLGTVPLLDSAVATSGNYENVVEIQGKVVHHIIDPRTGYPAPDVASVTVITPSGLDSDVFSTAIFAGGETLVASLRATRQRTRVFRVIRMPDGRSSCKGYGWSWAEQ